MYDVRCTMYDLENSASGAREAAKQMRTGCDEAVIGHGYKAAGAGRLTPPGGRQGLPMYDLRLKSSRALRGFFRNILFLKFMKVTCQDCMTGVK